MSQKPQHQIIFTLKSTKWQLIEWMRICANAVWAVGRRGGSRPGWAVMQKVPLPAPPLNPVPPSSPTPPPVPPTSPAPPAPPPFGSMVGASGGRPQANMHCTPIPPAPKLHSLSSQTILLSKSPETRSHSNSFLLMSQQGHKKGKTALFG